MSTSSENSKDLMFSEEKIPGISLMTKRRAVVLRYYPYGTPNSINLTEKKVFAVSIRIKDYFSSIMKIALNKVKVPVTYDVDTQLVEY